MSAYEDARRIAELQLMRDAIDAEITELKDKFRDTETQAYVDETGVSGVKLVVKVTPNKRIDDKLARENLEPNLYLQLSKSAIDTAKARAFLGADDLEKITKVYDNKVEVLVQ